jgi:hypothetical protein
MTTLRESAAEFVSASFLRQIGRQMAGNQIAKLRKPLNFKADGQGSFGFFIACQVAGFKHPVHLSLRVNFSLYGPAVNLTPEFNDIRIFLNVEAVRLKVIRTPLSVSLSKKRR